MSQQIQIQRPRPRPDPGPPADAPTTSKKITRLWFAAAGLVLTGAAIMSTAGPAMAGTPHDVFWWDNSTHAAYVAYERHPSPARFERMYLGSRHAATCYRVDIGMWHADAIRHAPRSVLARDARWVRADFSNYGQ